MRPNYVLVDFENVRPDSAELLADECFRLIVFVGASQAKIPFEFVASVQRMGCRAEYVRISGNGPNALDFHISYYIGRLSATEPTAFFHIISKDSGFDPLIEHLRGVRSSAQRFAAIGEIPIVRVLNARTPAQRLDVALGRLRQMKATKPASIKTLNGTISSLFLGRLNDDEVSAVVRGLVNRGSVSIVGNDVTYAPSVGV
ncbi:hypothetical protein ElP_63340 [Tautonia plasticadhaerens]|uniref:PIN-like domain-containing protein n=1 Tax=Tautonia plasticadhaerens TaxID=2527974 RepID=A0A518HC15_9BACT|nr:hypothetical protein ElP_63340 [Tautonia plasticadhaerens]